MEQLTAEQLKVKLAEAVNVIHFESEFTVEQVLADKDLFIEGVTETWYWNSKKEALAEFGFEVAPAGSAGGEGEGEEAFRVFRYVPTNQFIGVFGWYNSWEGYTWENVSVANQIPTFTYGAIDG